MKKPLSGTFLVSATVLVAITLSVLGIFKLRSWNRPGPSYANLTVSKLTGNEHVVTAAISPGGNEFAYVSTESGKQSLLVQSINESDKGREIVGPTDAVYRGLIFSPDGNFIFFVRSSGSEAPSVFRVAARGGDAVMLYPNVLDQVAVSADGRSLAYLRVDQEQKQWALVIGQVDAKSERNAAVFKESDGNFLSGSGLAFSPNGKLVVLAVRHPGMSNEYQTLSAVNILNGTVRPVGSTQFITVGQLSWHVFGGSLVMSAAKDTFVSHLWQLSYPTGELKELTRDGQEYQDVTISRDSRQILTVRTDQSGGSVVLLKDSE